MQRTNHQASNCSIARSLQVVGDKWTLLIVRESFYGATRYEQFHQVLKCPRNLLSQRLARLVEEGILETSEYREPGRRARLEYRMTDKGRELTPILLALMQWGDRYHADPEGPAAIARHVTCGKKLRVTLTCTGGHQPAGPHEIELVPGPGAVSERVATA